MDPLEKIGYTLLGLVAVCYFIAMLVGMVAIFPYGLIGLVVVVGVGLLFVKVLKDRINNKEDDHYAKKVDK